VSRNQREGRYVGHVEGQHVRWRARLGWRRRVQSVKARAVLRRRTYAPYGLHIKLEDIE
jgi:hypothetical protein